MHAYVLIFYCLKALHICTLFKRVFTLKAPEPTSLAYTIPKLLNNFLINDQGIKWVDCWRVKKRAMFWQAYKFVPIIHSHTRSYSVFKMVFGLERVHFCDFDEIKAHKMTSNEVCSLQIADSFSSTNIYINSFQ